MSIRQDDFEQQIAGIAALAEPVRRDLYRYVASQSDDVSRDQAASATGISRALAAFHLDKLVDEGLLEAVYRRLTGRTGPGAGRPSKLYRRSRREVSVSLPPRSYELAARLFASALDDPDATAARSLLSNVAQSFGKTLGADARAISGDNPGSEDLFTAAESALTAYGYEPYRDEAGDIRLRNCPFHALAGEHRQLVCGMNVQLMDGMIEGIGMMGVRASLEPRAGMCCVAFRREA